MNLAQAVRIATALACAFSPALLSAGCGTSDASDRTETETSTSASATTNPTANPTDTADATANTTGITTAIDDNADTSNTTGASGSTPVVDTSEAPSTTSAETTTVTGTTDTALPVVPDVANEHLGDDVFNEHEVQSYYLTFSDTEYSKLTDLSTLLSNRTTVNEDRYVEASLGVGDIALPAIGVRYKGQFSLWGCVDEATGERRVRVEPFYRDIDVCQRFSLKLDFNRYDAKGRLDGLKSLNLHAMAADPSKMRERLGYSLYRDMDVLAPRAVHARVYINGQYHGLFAAVEAVDGRFTAQRFPDSGDGNLYKEIWPSEHITNADALAALKTNDDVADVSDLLTFRDAVVAATEQDFATTVAAHVDFEYLARYIIVNRAINDFDGALAFYYGWGPPPANHNLFWYHDTESGRFVLIPWDLDKSFWYEEPNFWSDNAPNGLNVTPNWNVVTNSCDGYTVSFDNLGTSYKMMAIDCDPLLRLLREQIYDSQNALTEAFIGGAFSEQSVKAKLDAWRTQITTAVEEDPLLDDAHWRTSIDALLADLPNFQANVSLMMDGLIEE